MKKTYSILAVCLLFSSCEKIDQYNDLHFSAVNFDHSISPEEIELNNLISLINYNDKLLDSLKKNVEYVEDDRKNKARNEERFLKSNINNENQKNELIFWQSCFDSLIAKKLDYKFIHYLKSGYSIKPITKKDFKNRAKVLKANKVGNFDLAIYFCNEPILNCFATYENSINLITIYGYQDTLSYGNKEEYLSRAIVFFHELFHADQSSFRYDVNDQHLLIEHYEKELVEIALSLKKSLEPLLINNCQTEDISLFFENNYSPMGFVAKTSLYQKTADLQKEYSIAR